MAEEIRRNDVLGRIESRLEELTPREKTRWQIVIDRTLTTLVVALTIGFFAVMWRRSEVIDTLDEYRSENQRDFLRLEGFLKQSVVQEIAELRAHQEEDEAQRAQLLAELEKYQVLLNRMSATVTQLHGRVLALEKKAGTVVRARPLELPILSEEPLAKLREPRDKAALRKRIEAVEARVGEGLRFEQLAPPPMKR